MIKIGDKTTEKLQVYWNNFAANCIHLYPFMLTLQVQHGTRYATGLEQLRIQGGHHFSFSKFSDFFGIVVTLKTKRRQVPGSNPVALVDLAVRSFPWFSPKTRVNTG